MDDLLENVGILAIAFLIIYVYKKILEWHDYKRLGFYEDNKVYRAADEFVHGSPSDEIQAILADCYDFEEGDAERVMFLASSHRDDKDGGYRAFIRATNKVLGADVYDEKHRKRATGQ